MSQIAALLLMYLIDEEDAFWALSQLMVDNKYAMHGKYVRCGTWTRFVTFRLRSGPVWKEFIDLIFSCNSRNVYYWISKTTTAANTSWKSVKEIFATLEETFRQEWNWHGTLYSQMVFSMLFR